MAKKNKRQELIEVAMTLFNSRGYNAVSIQDILEAARTPKGTFYYYFSGKEDIIRHAISLYMADVSSWLRTYPSDIFGLRDFFKQQFKIMKDSGYREGCPVVNITTELASNDEDVREQVRLMEHNVRDYIKRSLMNTLHFNEQRAGEYARFILMSFHGSISSVKLERDGSSFAIFDRFIFDMLLRHDEKEVAKRYDRLMASKD